VPKRVRYVFDTVRGGVAGMDAAVKSTGTYPRRPMGPPTRSPKAEHAGAIAIHANHLR
jgi:hypothetical protein